MHGIKQEAIEPEGSPQVIALSSRPQPTQRLSQRLNRLGFHTLFVGAFAMLGGALRGFNLLLVLAGLLVGVLMIQWRWSRRSIEKIRISRLLSPNIFAGKAAKVRYQIHNRGYWMPAWMIRLEDTVESVQNHQLGVIASGTPLIEAGGQSSVSSEVLFSHRGKYKLLGLKAMTCFPFSLSTSILETSEAEDIIVFPRLFTMQKHWRKHLRKRSAGHSAQNRRQGSSEGEFYGLREWRNGDSQKWIHWRTSARLGELAVRQFEDQRRFDTCVIVDAFSDEQSDPDTPETAISLAASLTLEFLKSKSDHVDLLSIGKSAELILGQTGGQHARKLLSSLANLGASDHPEWTAAFDQVRSQRLIPKEIIVISTRTQKQFQSTQPLAHDLLTAWSRQNHLVWSDVRTDLKQWIQAEDSKENPVTNRPNFLEEDSAKSSASEMPESHDERGGESDGSPGTRGGRKLVGDSKLEGEVLS